MKLATSVELIFRGAVSIFLTSYVLYFKSYEFFKERTERFSVCNEKSKYTRHYSRYVTEGRATMLIRRFRNNDTRAFRKYWRVTKFRVINSKAIMISPPEICKVLLTPGRKPG